MAVPPPPFPPHEKAGLRRELRTARARHLDAIGPCGVASGVAAITRRLAPLLDGWSTIGGYVAHRGEPDMLALLLQAHERGLAVALPRMAEGEMRFVGWRPDAVLMPGFAGIPEPAPGATQVPATLLVPLLGFDRAGHRLGQGAGCYDRWLTAHRGVRAIGIAWSVQERPFIPADPWDVSLDAIATEQEWISP